MLIRLVSYVKTKILWEYVIIVIPTFWNFILGIQVKLVATMEIVIDNNNVIPMIDNVNTGVKVNLDQSIQMKAINNSSKQWRSLKWVQNVL